MIFVFGSNLAGIHGAGAARYAHQHHGAEWGVGEGMTGNSYALPTKDEDIQSVTHKDLQKSIIKFCNYARVNSDLDFELTPVGTGLAGFKKKHVAEYFRSAWIPSNVYLTSTWIYE